MAHPQIAVFARLADKNAQPVRKVEGQKTLLGRTMHGFTYDEIHDEFTVPQQFAQAILTVPDLPVLEPAPPLVANVVPLPEQRRAAAAPLPRPPNAWRRRAISHSTRHSVSGRGTNTPGPTARSNGC